MDKLKVGKEKFQGSYFIPEVWNCFGFKDYQVDPNRPEEISVNPYHFYLEGLKFITSQSPFRRARSTCQSGFVCS